MNTTNPCNMLQSLQHLNIEQKSDITKDNLTQIANTISSSNEVKLNALCNEYTDETLASARFDWTTKDTGFEYKNSNLFLVACRYGNEKLANRLLATDKISIDEKYSSLERTALMVAASTHQLNIIQLLLDAGADWRLTDNQNYRADQILLGLYSRTHENLYKIRDGINLLLNKATQTSEESLLSKGKLHFNLGNNCSITLCYHPLHVGKFIVMIGQFTFGHKTEAFAKLASDERTLITDAVSNYEDFSKYLDIISQIPKDMLYANILKMVGKTSDKQKLADIPGIDNKQRLDNLASFTSTLKMFIVIDTVAFKLNLKAMTLLLEYAKARLI